MNKIFKELQTETIHQQQDYLAVWTTNHFPPLFRKRFSSWQWTIQHLANGCGQVGYGLTAITRVDAIATACHTGNAVGSQMGEEVGNQVGHLDSPG